MRGLKLLAATACLTGLAAPSLAQAPETAPATEPATPEVSEESRALARAVERGRLLYRLDRAALLATRDMLAQIPDPTGAGINGFVAEPEGDDTIVTFYAPSGNGRAAVYRGVIGGGAVKSREVFAPGAGPALTPQQQRMAEARAASDSLERQSCAGSAFNVAVIPPEADEGPVEVYLFTPQATRGQFPMGGHYQAGIGQDGQVVSSRAFANSCVMLSAEGNVAGVSATSLAVAHPLDPIPTELHVFMSLWTGKPLDVTAGDRVWRVDAQGISIAE